MSHSKEEYFDLNKEPKVIAPDSPRPIVILDSDEETVPDDFDLHCYETLAPPKEPVKAKKDIIVLSSPTLKEPICAKDLVEDTMSYITGLNEDDFKRIFVDNVSIQAASLLNINAKHTEVHRIPIDQMKYEDAKKGAYKWPVHYKDVKSIKRQYYMYFRAELLNGFHSGFMAIVACHKCEAVLDAWPCLYKRIFWLSSRRCAYCKGVYPRYSYRDMKVLEECSKSRSKDNTQHSKVHFDK